MMSALAQDAQAVETATRVAKNKEIFAKAQEIGKMLETEKDPAERERLENEIKELEKQNMALYEVDSELKSKLLSAEQTLHNKYTNPESETYIGDNPVDSVSADFLTRSIVILVDQDKVDAGGVIPVESTEDGVPVSIRVVKFQEISCTTTDPKTAECRPVVGGISVSEQSKVPNSLNTLGYKATKNGEVGFVIAGHTAVAPLKYIVQPYTSATKTVGLVQYICWSGYATCDGDFAWVRAATDISVNNQIFNAGSFYSITSKTADSSQSVGTLVRKSGAGTGVDVGEIVMNYSTNPYIDVKIEVGGGDSGSPVFRLLTTSTVSIYGMISNMYTYNGETYARYYPQDYIETKIGAIASTS